MKNVLMILVLSLFLTACGGSDKPAVEENKSVSSQETEIEKDKTETEDDKKVDVVNSNEDTEKQEEALTDSAEALEPSQTDGTFELGKPYKLGDVVVTVKSLSFVKDDEGKTALKVVSDWENRSDKVNSPLYTYIITGYQNEVEMDLPFVLVGVDYGIGQQEVEPGEKIEGVETVVEIADMDTPMELVLEEYGNYEAKPLKMTVDLNTIE